MSAPWPTPEWLGRVPYVQALGAQRARREAILAGVAPEAVWALEHEPVITTGRRVAEGLPSAAWLAERGTTLVHTERGGLATWHGPGQLVVYLLVDISARRCTVRGTVAAIEAGVIAWLEGQGIAAARRPGAPGVWVGPDKIGAVGLHFRRGVSMHGLALNLCPDLAAYGWFTPCGIRDGGVTSVERVLGHSPAPAAVGPEVALEVLRALDAHALDAAEGAD